MVIAARATGKGVAKDSVFGNRPDDDEMDEMIAAFDELGGWDQSINPNAPAPVASNGAARQPAAATAAPAQPAQAAGSGTRRPFGRRTTADA